VFGVDLEHILQRENPNWESEPGAVPRIVEQCLAEIESRGLTEVGICKCCSGLYDHSANFRTDRVPGSSSAVKALEDAFESGRFLNTLHL
jgi:GTPase-activating protein BEM2